MKLLFLLFSLLTIFLFSSCSTIQKIDALKPEPTNALPLVYETTTSFIDLPIAIKLSDIENKTNSIMTGLIYEDRDITDDDLEVKLWKLAPITIKNDVESPGKIKTVLPLKVLVKYRIGTDKLGVDLYNIKEFQLNGTVTLLSNVSLSNWKLTTTTELKSFDWNESPTVLVLGKSVPITYLLNPAIKLYRSKIEKSIDDSIAKSMDFKPQVLDALDKICTPFLMNQEYQSWLRVIPIELYTTNAKVQKENVIFEMGLKCTLETIVGQKPISKFDKNALLLKAVAKMPDKISANIVAISSYQDASTIITKNFAGKEFGSGNKKIKVQNVAIWHKDSKLIIALDVQGSINGIIYLSGFPQYNEQNKELYFDQLEYVLDTKSRLIKTANWLAQGLVLKKIQESCRYSIKENLDNAKKSISQYLQNYSPMEGVFVNGAIETIDFQKVQLTDKAIIAFVKIKGAVNIKVDGFK